MLEGQSKTVCGASTGAIEAPWDGICSLYGCCWICMKGRHIGLTRVSAYRYRGQHTERVKLLYGDVGRYRGYEVGIASV